MINSIYRAATTSAIMRRSIRGWSNLRDNVIIVWATTTLIVCLVQVPCQGSSAAGRNMMTRGMHLFANKSETLLSPSGVFAMGFYAGRRTAGDHNQSDVITYTLAIWYAKINSPVKTVVWMANRSMNLSSNASIVLSADGELRVYDWRLAAQPLWTSKTASKYVTSAILLDTGNLILRNRIRNKVVWQSFDSPTDTLLPGQQLTASANLTLFAWRSHTDWARSLYWLGWGPNTLRASWESPYRWAPYSAKDYWDSGTAISSATLTADGVFRGVPLNTSHGSVSVIGTSSDAGTSRNSLRRVSLDFDGNLRMYTWTVGSSIDWTVAWQAVSDNCTIFGICGPFSICSDGQCLCPKGFQYVDPTEPTLGCKHVIPISFCNYTNPPVVTDYMFVESVDFPLGGDFMYRENVDVSTCKALCDNTCSCLGFSTFYPTSGNSACWLKKEVLLNGYQPTITSDRDTYIKFATVQHSQSKFSPKEKFIVVNTTMSATVSFLTVFSLVFGSFVICQKLRNSRTEKLERKWVSARGHVIRFSYKDIRLATRNFSVEIGRGGYGSVFKGEIGGLAVVAVKRLDRMTLGRETEFVNEVNTIGTIHHVNLVHLHGYCASGNHRLLVYEYMQNSSLDRLLFHPGEAGRVPLLEWRSRFQIAIGTARGLAYLHEEVRDKRIIHCDIKPENILLDSLLSAKVADFGLLRILHRDQTRTMTMHIRGTTGYLAPEWTSERVPITAKLDVYSFGMVLLEIISGRRNLKPTATINNTALDDDWYFPLWAFPKLEMGVFLEVVDLLLGGIVDATEVQRALQVAFWCINEKPDVRPSMAKVVQLLEGTIPIELPIPRPAFLDELRPSGDDSHQPWTSSSIIPDHQAFSSSDKFSQIGSHDSDDMRTRCQ